MILDQVFYLLDIDETPLRALPLNAEYKLEDLQESTNRIEVRLPLQDSGRVVTDQQLVFRGRRFSILGLGFDKDTSEIIITADELQARLVDVNNPTYVLKNETLPLAMTKAIAKAAGWTVGDVFETVLNYNAELKNVSTLFALRFLERQSGGRLFFDSGKKIIHMRKGDETIADVVFRYGKNVANITKEQTSPQATVLFPYGRDGMTIEALTGGKKYVEDFSWYLGLGMTLVDARKKYTKELVWTDDRYIYNANLHRDAVTRLAVLSQPQINYTLSNAQAEGVELGQLAYVHDEDLDIRVLVAVSKLIRSSNPEENEIELNYIPPSLGATIDNEYSGDTNQGGNGEVSLFQAKNQAVVAVSSIANTAITADVTVYSSTSFEIGAVLQLQVTTAGILSAYFTIDGERLPTDIKQTVPIGWHTVGVPFVVTGIQEGTKTLRFFVQFEGSGAASIAKEKAELYIKASGVYGGASNDKPDQTILEEVEPHVTTLLVSENMIEFRDLPRLFALYENINMQNIVTAQGIEETNDIYLDPPPLAVAPPAPLSDTQIRSEFANMSYYSQTTRPTQTQADYFIDVAQSNAARYLILADHFTVYILATKGTFLNVEFPTEGNPIITSDDFIYYTFGTNNINAGKTLDWSINNQYPKSIVEVYEVAPYAAPGEEGPPRRIQYVEDYSLNATAIAPAPDTFGRISLTPVVPGRVYRITRAAASDVFATAFVTKAPALNGTTETIVTGYTAQAVDLLIYDATAPAGVTHVVAYESGETLEPITIRMIAPNEVVVTKTITVSSNGSSMGNIVRTAAGAFTTSDSFGTQYVAADLAGAGYIKDISVWNRSSSGASAFKILLLQDTNGSPDYTRKLYESDVIPVTTTTLTKFTVTNSQGIPIVDNAVYWIVATGRGLGSGSHMLQGTTTDSSIPIMKYNAGENTWATSGSRLAYEITIGTK